MANQIAVGYISILPETSKIAPGIKEALGKVDPSPEAKTAGAKFSGALSKTLKVGAVSAGGAVGGVLAASMAKGFSRLNKIDQATAKLGGLGNSAEATAEIMKNANAAVKGTAYGLDAAATTAAAAVASGIKPGEELTSVLKTIGDTAAIAGTDMADMGSIFNGIAARNKATMLDLNRLMDRGVPALDILSEKLGVSAAEVSDMVSKGQIDFETFASAMSDSMGGAALKMGDTFSGALANMGAAAGRVGAKILDPFFKVAPKLMGAVTSGLDGVGAKIEPAVKTISAKLNPLVDGLAERLPAMWDGLVNNPEVQGRLQTLGGVFDKVRDAAATVGPPIGRIAAALGKAAGQLAVGAWDSLVRAFDVAAPIVKNVLAPALSGVAGSLEKLGPVLPVVAGGFIGIKAGGKALDTVSTGFKKTVDRAKETRDSVKSVYDAVKSAPEAFGKVRDGVAGAVGAVKTGVEAVKNFSAVTKIASGVQAAFNAVMAMNPIGLIVAGVAAAVGALTWFFTKTETGKAAWESITTGMKVAWDAVSSAITTVINSVLVPAWDWMKTKLSEVGAAAVLFYQSYILPAWDGVKNAVTTAVGVAVGAFARMRDGVSAVGQAVVGFWQAHVTPAFEGIKSVVSGVIDTITGAVFPAFRNAFTAVKDHIGNVVQAIKDVWGSMRAALAKPINFLINTVYNKGIAGAWNKVSTFLPGLKQAPLMAGIPEHAAGGKIVGPGTGTSDSVLMWGSAGEHMMTAREVLRAGGHDTVYAMRDLLAHGKSFTWEDGRLFAYDGQPSSSDNRPIPQVLPKYKDGGEIRPQWESQLARGHEWAKAQSGKPYMAGNQFPRGGDCSGYMSAIASVILTGDPKGHWATPAFPAGQAERVTAAGQPWVAGLGKGFSIGMSGGPNSGGAAGHTAGTLSAAGPFSAVNVESGGSHGNVAYGGPAVGADHGQFPTRYHLAIGAHGGFEAAGGPSSSTMISSIKNKIKSTFEGRTNPIFGALASAVGTPPPEYYAAPGAFLKTGKDKSVKYLLGLPGRLGDKLGAVYDKAKAIGAGVIDSVFRDTGGWLPRGLTLVRNETGKPEAVLNWKQVHEVSDFVQHDFGAAAEASGNAAAKAFASEFGVSEDKAHDPLAVGAAIGREFLGTAARSGLGLFGLDGLVDVASSLESKYKTLDKAARDTGGGAADVTVDNVTVTGVPAAVADDVAADVDGTAQKPTPTTGHDGYVAAIAQAAKGRGLPAKGAAIGVATALVESGEPLRNLANKAVPESLNYPHDGLGADHDSVGLFQQRPGWGTVADRMDPSRSAGMFFDAMLKSFPGWESMEPGAVAQGVQRSAFPGRYATRMGHALELVKTAAVYDQGGLLPPDGLAFNFSGRTEGIINHEQWGAIDQLGTALTNPPENPYRGLVQDLSRMIPPAVAQGTRAGLAGGPDGGLPMDIGAPLAGAGGETTVQIQLTGDAFSADQVESMCRQLSDRVDKLSIQVEKNSRASVLSGATVMT